MLLLTGPPGAGKTSYCLLLARSQLRNGAGSATRVLTPTTTMAEHLRNDLVREGFVFSPKVVSTFGKFVADYVRDLPVVSRAALELIVRDELIRLPLRRYADVQAFPGFRSAMVRAVEEFAATGGTCKHLTSVDPDFAAVFSAVASRVTSAGLYFRAERLQHAAERIPDGPKLGTVCVTGFFGFTATELKVLRAMCEVCESLVVALAETPGSRPALEVLRTFAAAEQQLPDPQTKVPRTLFTAATVDGEANEVARRVMIEHSAGRPFHEIGVIVRSEQPIAGALQTAFERFSIPSRSYFAQRLDADPTVRYLVAIVDAALSGWDHETTLRFLRMHGSPLELAGDQFEFHIREQLPAKGLESLRDCAPEWVGSWFESLNRVTSWGEAGPLPAKTWQHRFSGLPKLIWRLPIAADEIRTEQVLRGRRENAALAHFQAVVDEAAKTLGESTRLSCQEFRVAVQAALGATELHLVDRRREVVHVIDAVEARQWRLPVIFVPGLLHDQFPKHRSEDPILSDQVRRELQAQGLQLRTSVEWQAEEQALFDLALTRSTRQLILSYPLLNRKGEPNLPSALLSRAKPYSEERAQVWIKPRPSRRPQQPLFPLIAEPELRQQLARRHHKISPSGVEKYISCPWSFFAQRVLKLRQRPVPPFDRLDVMLQGEIGHDVLQRVVRDGSELDAVFDDVFRAACQAKHVPDGYRKESIRLELLQGLRTFVRDARLEFADPPPMTEQDFEFELTPEISIHGRIDYVHVDQSGRALVIDYKYKRKARIEAAARENVEGRRVQAGLYLLAARKLGFEPGGMLYAGFKREASYSGWVVSARATDAGVAACVPGELEDRIAKAREMTLQMAADIADGRIVPDPWELRECERCPYSGACRMESVPARAGEVMNAAQ